MSFTKVIFQECVFVKNTL